MHSKAAFSALLTKRDKLKNCCEMLTLQSQCISVLAAMEKELREKLANRENIDATEKATAKFQGRKRAIAGYNGVVALEAQLAET